MPTLPSHAIAAMAIVAGAGRAVPGKLALAGAVCAMLPDVDVISFRLGIRYEDLLGHRGLTHSVAFAAAMATVLVGVGGFSAFGRRRVWACLFLCGVSHGLLDAATNGGLGIAFWSPFSNVRYFLPWRPIQVSPIGLTRILSQSSLEILISELRWVWVPSLLLIGATWSWLGAMRRAPRQRR